MITEAEVRARLICNDALFENIFLCQQKFEIVPYHKHIGASIAYQDIQELKTTCFDTSFFCSARRKSL